MAEDTWHSTFALARQLASAPSGSPWLELHREAQPTWEGKVAVHPHPHHRLLIHRIDEKWPQANSLTVFYRRSEMVFNLWEDLIVIEVDRATPENAYPVLDALLTQLTATT